MGVIFIGHYVISTRLGCRHLCHCEATRPRIPSKRDDNQGVDFMTTYM